MEQAAKEADSTVQLAARQQWRLRSNSLSPESVPLIHKHESTQHHGSLQGLWVRFRRSLDANFANYNKLDQIFEDALRCPTAQGRLDVVCKGLVTSRLVGFASFCVLGAKKNFGVGAIQGSGVEYFPPVMNPTSNSNKTSASGERGFSLITSTLFNLQSSNWSIEDVASSLVPCFYDCTSPGRGLPKEAEWLRKVGMHSMLSMPCIHEGVLQGVMIIATKLSEWDQLLLRKLQELCYKVTPFIVGTRASLARFMSKTPAHKFRSMNDIAAIMMDELINLDKILVASISSRGDLCSSLDSETAAQVAAAASQGSHRPKAQQANNTPQQAKSRPAGTAAARPGIPAGFTTSSYTNNQCAQTDFMQPGFAAAQPPAASTSGRDAEILSSQGSGSSDWGLSNLLDGLWSGAQLAPAGPGQRGRQQQPHSHSAPSTARRSDAEAAQASAVEFMFPQFPNRTTSSPHNLTGNAWYTNSIPGASPTSFPCAPASAQNRDASAAAATSFPCVLSSAYNSNTSAASALQELSNRLRGSAEYVASMAARDSADQCGDALGPDHWIVSPAVEMTGEASSTSKQMAQQQQHRQGQHAQDQQQQQQANLNELTYAAFLNNGAGAGRLFNTTSASGRSPPQGTSSRSDLEAVLQLLRSGNPSSVTPGPSTRSSTATTSISSNTTNRTASVPRSTLACLPEGTEFTPEQLEQQQQASSALPRHDTQSSSEPRSSADSDRSSAGSVFTVSMKRTWGGANLSGIAAAEAGRSLEQTPNVGMSVATFMDNRRVQPGPKAGGASSSGSRSGDEGGGRNQQLTTDQGWEQFL